MVAGGVSTAADPASTRGCASSRQQVLGTRQCWPSKPLSCSVFDSPLTQNCTLQHIAVLHTKPCEEEAHATQQLLGTNLLGRCSSSLASWHVIGMTCISTDTTPAACTMFELCCCMLQKGSGIMDPPETGKAEHSTGDELGRIDHEHQANTPPASLALNRPEPPGRPWPPSRMPTTPTTPKPPTPPPPCCPFSSHKQHMVPSQQHMAKTRQCRATRL